MYKFQHIVKDMRGEEVMEVNVTLPGQHHTATEVVENFVHFMQGCGFVRESVLRAMAEAAEELSFDD